MIEFYNTFTLAPDFSSPPVSSFSDGRRDLQLGAAQRYGIYDQKGKRSLNATWRINSPVDMREVRRFLEKNQGRANPFYIPSWSQDFSIQTTTPTGGKAVNIKIGIDYVVDLSPELLDKFGTIAWFYSRDRELHVTRIIDSSPGTGETTNIAMETPTPFELRPGTFCGFCLFARQAIDETQIRYTAPGVAEMTFAVEEAVHTLPLIQNQTVPGQDIFSFPAMTEVRQTPIQPGTNLSFISATVLGPEQYDLNQTYPHQRAWEFKITDNGVEMKRGFDEPIESELFSAKPEGEHISASFDIGGKEHIAIGLTNGDIEVRFRDGSNQPTTSRWTGFAPQAINTWAVDASVTAGEADNVVVYLKQGESKLYARFSAGFYSTEYLLTNSPVNPLYLTDIEASAGELRVQGLDVTHNTAIWAAVVDAIIPQWLDNMAHQTTAAGGLYASALLRTTQEFPIAPLEGSNVTTNDGLYEQSLNFTTGEDPGTIHGSSVTTQDGLYIPALKFTNHESQTYSQNTTIESAAVFYARPITPDYPEAGKWQNTTTIQAGLYEIE